jgi:hypothetical protein
VEPRVGVERPRVQRRQRCLRHPAGASRKQDGVGRRRLAVERGDADLLGPRVHLRSLWEPLRPHPCAPPPHRAGAPPPSFAILRAEDSRRVPRP